MLACLQRRLQRRRLRLAQADDIQTVNKALCVLICHEAARELFVDPAQRQLLTGVALALVGEAASRSARIILKVHRARSAPLR